MAPRIRCTRLMAGTDTHDDKNTIKPPPPPHTPHTHLSPSSPSPLPHTHHTHTLSLQRFMTYILSLHFGFHHSGLAWSCSVPRLFLHTVSIVLTRVLNVSYRFDNGLAYVLQWSYMFLHLFSHLFDSCVTFFRTHCFTSYLSTICFLYFGPGFDL